MKLNKEHTALFILCAAAGILWMQSAGIFRSPSAVPGRVRTAQRYEFAPSDDQSRREPIPSGFQRPEAPPAAGPIRSTLSVRELRIMDRSGNVVLRAGVSPSGTGIWMGRPGSAAEFEAGVQSNGSPFFQLYAEGRPGVAWSGVETESTPSLHFRGGDHHEVAFGLAPTSQSEKVFLTHTNESGNQVEVLY